MSELVPAQQQSRIDCSILLVDDEPVVVRVVSKHLRKAGYQDVICLTEPDLVMDWIRSFRPGLALLDIFMPGTSGLDLLQQIRADQSLDEVVVLMLSSAGQEEQFQSLEMGAMGFIQKPTTQQELDEQIQRTLKVASRVRKL